MALANRKSKTLAQKRLFLVDASCFFYHIHNASIPYGMSEDELTKYAIDSLLWVQKAGLFPESINRAQNTVIWLTDSKPYWRTALLPIYKANRSDPPEELSVIQDAFDYLVRHGLIVSLSRQSYEADDLAALFTHLWRRRNTEKNSYRELIYLTTDGDWQGLVSEGIYWASLSGNQSPRVRNRALVHYWLSKSRSKASKKRQAMWSMPNLDEFECSDLWDWKAINGDPSDNLKVRDLDKLDRERVKEIISLLYPPPQHNLINNQFAVRETLATLTQAEDLNQRPDYKEITAHVLLQELYKVGTLPCSPINLEDLERCGLIESAGVVA